MDTINNPIEKQVDSSKTLTVSFSGYKKLKEEQSVVLKALSEEELRSGTSALIVAV